VLSVPPLSCLFVCHSTSFTCSYLMFCNSQCYLVYFSYLDSVCVFLPSVGCNLFVHNHLVRALIKYSIFLFNTVLFIHHLYLGNLFFYHHGIECQLSVVWHVDMCKSVHSWDHKLPKPTAQPVSDAVILTVKHHSELFRRLSNFF